MFGREIQIALGGRLRDSNKPFFARRQIDDVVEHIVANLVRFELHIRLEVARNNGAVFSAQRAHGRRDETLERSGNALARKGVADFFMLFHELREVCVL